MVHMLSVVVIVNHETFTLPWNARLEFVYGFDGEDRRRFMLERFRLGTS